jgi:hypothetical protein
MQCIITFSGVLQNFLFECCHYSRYDICAVFSAHRKTQVALYRCYTFCTRNSDTLYRQLLILS